MMAAAIASRKARSSLTLPLRLRNWAMSPQSAGLIRGMLATQRLFDQKSTPQASTILLRPVRLGRQQDAKQLKQLLKEDTHTRVIGRLKLDRSEASIYDKAQRECISLKPTNQRPYNRGGR